MTLKVQYIFIIIWKNSKISIERIQEDQKQFQSKLNEIATENPKYRLKDQLDTIKILKIFKTQEKKKNQITYNDYVKIISEAMYKTNLGEGLKN